MTSPAAERGVGTDWSRDKQSSTVAATTCITMRSSPAAGCLVVLLVVVVVTWPCCGGASRVSLSYQDVDLRLLECPVSDPHDPDCFGMYQDQLDEFIANLIANMDQPNDQLGLPPLDPLELNDISLNLATGFIDVNGSLSLKAVGLKQLNVTFDKFCLQGFQLFLNLSLPSIVVTGEYDIRGWLGGDLLYIFGDGNWNLSVTDIRLYVNVGLNNDAVADHMYVGHMELGVYLESVQVYIDNLYHDADLTGVLNEVVAIALPQLLVLYKQEATCFASDAVVGLLNSKLLTVSMSDLLCIIAGIGCR